jgi:chromosome segregation ATPase
VRISTEQRQENERRIRDVMSRMLSGQIPAGGKCDVKTLAREAKVDRTAFYGTRPYTHLREEFETQLQAHQQAGDFPDRRDAQIQRMKAEIDTLRQRLTRRDQTIVDLSDFKTQALARLTAQHEEIQRLRRQTDQNNRVRRLTPRGPSTGPCS